MNKLFVFSIFSLVIFFQVTLVTGARHKSKTESRDHQIISKLLYKSFRTQHRRY
jgi:hypothetical protein